jgi:putative dimethyl sulfoxide reductase chaperone
MKAVSELGHLFLDAPRGLESEREYTRLFLSPSGAPCPPWQSLYEEEEPRLMGAAHHRALAWYRKFGFEPANPQEPADHAGLLLLFYAHLLENGAEEEQLEAFEREHLVWLGGFATKLIDANAAEPYRSAAEALLAFLEEEA